MSEHPSAFAQLGIIPDLVDRLTAEGITEPTPIQDQSIPVLMEGRDLLGLAQTGTGKTAAYLLPLIQAIKAAKEAGKPRKAPAALILAPTRELAHQVAASIKQFSQGMGIRYLVVCGGERYDGQINALRKGVDLLVATPGRFEDLRKRGVIDLGAVAHLVLDEADQMIDLGFYPAIRRICNAITTPHQTIFFSATMPEEMQALSEEFLTDSVTVRIKNRNITADTVNQKAILVGDGQKRDALVDLLRDTDGEQVLVFVATKRYADTISSFLHAQDFSVDVLHGDIRQHIRTKVLRKFKTGAIQVLVATDVAARGIDVTGLNWVINFDLPQIPEVYVHRIGRTGRAQQKGQAISLCAPSQISLLHAISRHTKGVIDIVSADGEPVTIEEARSRSKERKPGMRKGKPFNRRKPKPGGNRPRRPMLEADTPPDHADTGTDKPRRKKAFNGKGRPRHQDARFDNKPRSGKRRPGTAKPGTAKPGKAKSATARQGKAKPGTARPRSGRPPRRQQASG